MSEFGLADLATILIGLAIVGMAIFLGMLTIYSWPMLAQIGRAISRRYFDIAWPHLIDRIADDAMSSYDAVPDVDQKWPERRSYAVDRLSDQPGTVGGNEVLAWLAEEVGLPSHAGGVFVQGGTLGNLSALVAARHSANVARQTAGLTRPERWKFVCSEEAHSSLKAAAAVMDVDIVKAKVNEAGRLTGEAVAEALVNAGDGVFAVVATAGTTNFGIVDKLEEVAEVAKELGVWFHVDGAYGLAGMLSHHTRPLFKGLEHADSFIVDPHKWLFAPFDACALVYRDPEIGRLAHTQHGEYLDTLTSSGDYNPSDYAINLTRRPRGLPLWFSLATHGIQAYRDAVTKNIEIAHFARNQVKLRDYLELVREPELSVVVFERVGWTLEQYEAWSKHLLAQNIAFVVPSSHQGRPNARFAIVNPLTSEELINEILDSME